MYEIVLLLFGLNLMYLCGGNSTERSNSILNFKRRKLDDKINWQIVGGRAALPDDFNYQASVVYKEAYPYSQKLCSGVIVTRKHILTSALCVCDFSKKYCSVNNFDDYRVYVGSTLKWNFERYYYPYGASQINLHPDFFYQDLNVIDGGQYVMSLKHDIAVMTVYPDFYLDDQVRPIPLLEPDSAPTVGQMEEAREECSVFGWGFTRPPKPGQEVYAVPRRLQYAELKLVPFQECFNKWRADGFHLTYGRHVCASNWGKSVCTGDGGGGLVCNHKGKKFLMGIVSIAYSCGRSDVPSVFTRVDVYMGFIRSIIGYDDVTKSTSGVCSIQPLTLLHYIFFYVSVYCFLWKFNKNWTKVVKT